MNKKEFGYTQRGDPAYKLMGVLILFKDGDCMLLSLHIHSAHLKILGFPVGGAY